MRIVSFIAMLILFASAPAAFAQDNAKIDATATFKDAPPPPLSLKAQQVIAFGTINIPLKIAGNPTCRYVVDTDVFDANGTRTSVGASNSDGTTATVANAGCAFSGIQRAGRIVLGCEKARTVQINVVYASTAPTGATFSNRDAGYAGRYIPELAAGDNESAGLPLAGAFVCKPNKDGTVLLLLTGVLNVANNATIPRGSQVTVGTVTVDASY